MRTPAMTGIFAFRVFAHDDPVELLARIDVAQRTPDSGQDARRPDVSVLVERLADREAQAPQRDVVRDIGRAHRAKVDGIRIAIARDHPAAS